MNQKEQLLEMKDVLKRMADTYDRAQELYREMVIEQTLAEYSIPAPDFDSKPEQWEAR